MDVGLSGKRAIVTGGSSGIGKAVARELLANGASVVIAARNRERLDKAADELRGQAGSPVRAVPCDTSSDGSVTAMLTEGVEFLGGLDILVNCAAASAAGIAPPKLDEITAEGLWADVNVKVMGYMRCIRASVPHMVRSGGGRVVNISGLAARSTGSTIGTIRNVAVAALTKTLADELAPQRITLVVVHPGFSRTERTGQLLERRAAQLGVSVGEAERQLGSQNLLGRVVDAEEVAKVVAFLASPLAVIVNGDSVAVGGGVPGSIYY